MKRPWLAAAAVTMACASSPAIAQECISDEQLLELSIDDVPGLIGCSQVGRMFLTGLGSFEPANLRVRFGEPVPAISEERLEAYRTVRTLLLNVTMRERYSAEIDARVISEILLWAMSEAHHLPVERRQIYVAYYVLESWESHGGETSELGHATKLLIGKALANTNFTSLEQIRCFTLADILTFSIDQIVESRIFNECIEQHESG